MLTKLVVATVSVAWIVQVHAGMAPSYPEPGTVWKTGQTYKIEWEDDKSTPSIAHDWKDFKIDLMTGDNIKQKFLMNVATGIDGKKAKNYSFQAPEVHPPSAVYFLMFTNTKGDNAWTTRFAITGQDDELVEPDNAKQPDGTSIPWGVGKLGKDPAGQKPAKGANVAAVKPENAEVDAMEPEKAADHAEPEVIQAAIPGAVMDGMTDVHPKYEPPPLDEVAPVDAPLNEASVASRLGQPIAGVLFLSLLANLLL